MFILAKIILIFVVVLQSDLVSGSRTIRAAVNRKNEIKLLVAATKTLLSTTASQEQLTQLKKAIPRCAAKNLAVIRSIFRGNLLQFIGSILNPGGRRKRDAVIIPEHSPLSNQTDAGKVPLTRTQDINTIVTQATKIFNIIPSARLVIVRQVAQGVAGNFLIRGPFLFAVVGSAQACANANSSG